MRRLRCLSGVLAAAGVTVLAAALSPAAATASAGYVHVGSTGHGLILNGSSYEINGATGYGQYGNPSAEVALAQKMNLNNLEAVEFFCQYHTLPDAESSCTMSRLDAYVAAAEASGRHVVLNLSEYGQSLAAAGQNPCTTDWAPYLSFLAGHVNASNGRRYGTDPGLSMVEIWGEIPAPNYGGAVCTTSQMQSFYSRTLAELRQDFPDTMLSTGGFSYLNDPNSGIPWKTIMADPNDQVCSLEINSAPDRDVSYPAVVSYCNGLATPKPTWIAAWSSCNNPSQYNGDISDYTTQAGAAGHATQMLQYADKADTAGSDFWNLRTVTGWPAGSCDIGNGVPTIESAVTAGEK